MYLFYFAAIELGRSDAGNRHVLEVCNGLAERGHVISLFLPFRRFPSTTLHSNIQVIPVPVVYGRTLWLTTLSFYLALPWWSWRHFVRLRPAIVYTRASFLDWVAIAPLRLFFRFEYVAELNGVRSLESKRNRIVRRLIAWQEQFSMRLCDMAVGVTPELCQWAISIGKLRPEKTAAIGNGVSVDLFYPMPCGEAKETLRLDCHVRYLGFVGSLKPWHGTHTLVRALPGILAEFPRDVRLLVVGDGPERARLMRLAQELGVDHAVDWIGQVPSDKVPLYINASEICLAPFSCVRNVQIVQSPIKAFEYMGCGRPFVSTRIGSGYDDMIEFWRCGVQVPPSDATALARAVVKLMHDPELREQLGRRGRQAAVQQYSWAKIAERTEQFIIESMRDPGGSG